ncbi:MAG: hypothetical protein ACU0DW_13865 [Shimia sp.]
MRIIDKDAFSNSTPIDPLSAICIAAICGLGSMATFLVISYTHECSSRIFEVPEDFQTNCKAVSYYLVVLFWLIASSVPIYYKLRRRLLLEKVRERFATSGSLTTEIMDLAIVLVLISALFALPAIADGNGISQIIRFPYFGFLAGISAVFVGMAFLKVSIIFGRG